MTHLPRAPSLLQTSLRTLDVVASSSTDYKLWLNGLGLFLDIGKQQAAQVCMYFTICCTEVKALGTTLYAAHIHRTCYMLTQEAVNAPCRSHSVSVGDHVVVADHVRLGCNMHTTWLHFTIVYKFISNIRMYLVGYITHTYSTYIRTSTMHSITWDRVALYFNSMHCITMNALLYCVKIVHFAFTICCVLLRRV